MLIKRRDSRKYRNHPHNVNYRQVLLFCLNNTHNVNYRQVLFCLNNTHNVNYRQLLFCVSAEHPQSMFLINSGIWGRYEEERRKQRKKKTHNTANVSLKRQLTSLLPSDKIFHRSLQQVAVPSDRIFPQLLCAIISQERSSSWFLLLKLICMVLKMDPLTLGKV